jgi:alpha-glucuronidase
LTKVEPWEAGSGRGAVELPGDVTTGAIRYRYEEAAGQRDLRFQYFDEEDGVSKFKLFVADKLIDQWSADQHVPTPTTVPDAHSSSCRIIRGVMLKPGDEIRIEGTADSGERAAVDYLEVIPSH